MTGPARLADELHRAHERTSGEFATQGVVVDGSTATQVAVDLGDGIQLWPRLTGYTPTIGHVVLLVGGPGWWVVLGALA